MYGCDGGTHSIETADAWSAHSIVAHGFKTKVEVLNLEGGRGREMRGQEKETSLVEPDPHKSMAP